jgi:hypothetical protein
MARKHAQILTSIWMDNDFAQLTATQQRAYLFLLSQPDLSLVGVLVARTRVWARRAEGMTRLQLEDDLEALHRHGLIVWDTDTDEVWLRSFHKHNVAGSPKALIGASRALGAVVSPTIRDLIVGVVHPELREAFASGMAGVRFDQLRQMVADLPAWDTPSHTPCDTPSEGVSPTETRDLIPETRDQRLVTTCPTPGLALVPVNDTPAAPVATNRYPDDFEKFWQQYPRKTGKGAALKVWKRLPATAKATALDAIAEHSTAWAAWPASDHQFIPNPSTWLSQARYDDPPPTATRRGPTSKADANMAKIAASVARAQGGGPWT